MYPNLEARVSAGERRQLHADARIEELVQDMTKSYEGISDFLGRIEDSNAKRFSSIETRLTEHEKRFSSIETLLAEHSKRFGDIETLLAEHSKLLNQILTRLLENH